MGHSRPPGLLALLTAAALAVLLACPGVAHAQAAGIAPPALAPSDPLSLLDVPYLSQSELLCGGAAAAMVLRYWGQRDIDAQAFAHLVNPAAGGIGTQALVDDLADRGWTAAATAGDDGLLRREIGRGRPVMLLIEDRPGAFHYVVAVGWHERAVVVHDPARAPFIVMPAAEFSRRWAAADRWMAIVLPGDVAGGEESGLTGEPRARDGDVLEPAAGCEALVQGAVAAARAGSLDAAERALASAVACPGPSALRELAGLRLLQRRWDELEALASVLVRDDPADAYAWQLLGVGRFVRGEALDALTAWNHAGQPMLDLVQVDGLSRTRHRVIERLLDVDTGTMLTPGTLVHARRRLAELPSADASRLVYVPQAGGRAELRGTVVEAPRLPRGWGAIGTLAASTLTIREVRVSTGSFTGGGEQFTAAWRFRPHRTLYELGVRAPAPWGGVWGATAFHEERTTTLPTSDRFTGGRLFVADWIGPALRWQLDGGVERWNGQDVRLASRAGVAVASAGDRLTGEGSLSAWSGRSGSFGIAEAGVRLASRSEARGTRVVGELRAQTATAGTPSVLLPAGDTGAVRPLVLRAHPLLQDGRLRADRLGRLTLGASLEVQRWFRPHPLALIAPALFLDVARTSRRSTPGALDDADLGLGVRLAMPGRREVLRIDLATGLRDGRTALSFVLVR